MTRTEAKKQAVIIMKDLAEQFRDHPEAYQLTIHREALLPLELCDPEVEDDETTIEEWMIEFMKAIND